LRQLQRELNKQNQGNASNPRDQPLPHESGNGRHDNERNDPTFPISMGNVNKHDNETTAKVAKTAGLKRTQYERMRDIKKQKEASKEFGENHPESLVSFETKLSDNDKELETI